MFALKDFAEGFEKFSGNYSIFQSYLENQQMEASH